MRHTFFSTKRSQIRSATTSNLGATEDSVETGVKDGGTSLSHPYFFNLKFRKNTKAIDDLQELLDKIYLTRFNPIACMNFMRQLIIFLGMDRNRGLINQVPSQLRANQFNPLELILTLGEMSVAKQLLKLGAEVRPQHRKLYEMASKLSRSANKPDH